MNRKPFYRKILYLVMIAVLLVPLSMLSQPATVGTARSPGSTGGQLAQLRDRYQLGQSSLGEIDPTSETLKLATLGLRGVAALVLWNKADQYKEQEDWTNLSAVLEQITHLQPNYIGVWQYQAHNIAFNVAAEWDDIRDHYYWVIKGIEFLQKGIGYNAKEPRLLSDVGFCATTKIGRSDHRRQFRELFRNDDDFHRTQVVKQRDNFLYSKEYYRLAQNLVDNEGIPPGTGDVQFHVRPVMAQIHYSSALQNDGTFGDAARQSWEQSLAELRTYGQREFPDIEQGIPFRLADLELAEAQLEETIAELDALQPGLRDALRDRRMEQLSDELLAAYRTPADARTATQARLAAQAEARLAVPDVELVEQLDDSALRARGRERIDAARQLRVKLHAIRMSRESINYDYWLDRCAMEASPDALAARELIYRARKAYYEEADLVRPRRQFETAFAHWRKVLDAYPRMHEDQTAQEMIEAVNEYEAILKQLDEPFPKDFPLREIVELRAAYGALGL